MWAALIPIVQGIIGQQQSQAAAEAAARTAAARQQEEVLLLSAGLVGVGLVALFMARD